MKKFSFSMQKVLDLREFERKQAETDLGRALAAENAIRQALELVAQQHVSAVAAADSMTDVHELYGVNQYFALLAQRKERLLCDLAQAQLVSEQKREVMREAMKKCKVLEQLRESRLAAWKKERLSEEELVIDDIVTSRFEPSI
ncbi:MAG: flagellar export protein FliJ [Treponemataceae bacterium]|nr:flagellar export protein FliJ [Treponemataceae bacterium]